MLQAPCLAVLKLVVAIEFVWAWEVVFWTMQDPKVPQVLQGQTSDMVMVHLAWEGDVWTTLDPELPEVLVLQEPPEAIRVANTIATSPGAGIEPGAGRSAAENTCYCFPLATLAFSTLARSKALRSVPQAKAL